MDVLICIVHVLVSKETVENYLCSGNELHLFFFTDYIYRVLLKRDAYKMIEKPYKPTFQHSDVKLNYIIFGLSYYKVYPTKVTLKSQGIIDQNLCIKYNQQDILKNSLPTSSEKRMM